MGATGTARRKWASCYSLIHTPKAPKERPLWLSATVMVSPQPSHPCSWSHTWASTRAIKTVTMTKSTISFRAIEQDRIREGRGHSWRRQGSNVGPDQEPPLLCGCLKSAWPQVWTVASEPSPSEIMSPPPQVSTPHRGAPYHSGPFLRCCYSPEPVTSPTLPISALLGSHSACPGSEGAQLSISYVHALSQITELGLE